MAEFAAAPLGAAPAMPANYPANRKAAMAILLMASFMNLIDVTVVNGALPSMASTLNATSSQLQWVIAAYTLAFSLGLLPFGRLGDTFGRRRMFLAGVGAFTFASLLCGLAPSIEWLIFARVLQGLAGAMMTPQTLAIAQVIFPPEERAGIFALFGFASGLAAVTGPLLGGFLIHLDIAGLTWRPIFLINIPVGILAIVLGLRIIPKVSGIRTLGVDFVGIAIAALALLLITYPMIEGRSHGWPVWTFAMMAASLPLFYIFVKWQQRQSSKGAPEVLPATLLSNRAFITNAMLSSLFFSVIPGFFFAFTFYFQAGYGFEPYQSGIASLPFSFGVLFASAYSSRLGTRGQTQRLFGGAVLLAAGFLAMSFLSSPENPPTQWRYAIPLLAGGIGLGLAVSPMFQRALGSVVGRDAGAASGGLQAIQQAGGAIGVAVTGELFFSQLSRTGGATPGADAYTAAFHIALWYGIIAFIIVAISAVFGPKPVLTKPA
jgi:EmrB/QacA subfamily drug resistance transporter